jgi:hypothetical protein
MLNSFAACWPRPYAAPQAIRYRCGTMTAIPWPRMRWALLALAFLLALLGPAAARPADAAGPAQRLAANAPLAAGQPAFRERAPRAQPVADRRDERDRLAAAPLAVVTAAAGVGLLLAGILRLAAAGRGRRGRAGAAEPRGPPFPLSF